MRKINSITVHCSAGFGDIESIKKFWREVLGWRSPGYAIIIDLEGCRHDIWPLERPTNGVKGHNGDSIHIAYIGGVDPNDYTVAKDTRTYEQKKGLELAIRDTLIFLKDHQDICGIQIKGHRDFSEDQNGDGVISSWERIKECPSFDAIPTYEHLIDSI